MYSILILEISPFSYSVYGSKIFIFCCLVKVTPQILLKIMQKFTTKVYVVSILEWFHVIQVFTLTEAFLGQNVTIIGLWLKIVLTITCQ